MPDHVALQILDQLETELTGLTTTGSNTHIERVLPLGEDDLPALNLVYGGESEIEEMGVGSNPALSRAMALTIEINVAETADAYRELLTIAKEAEAAMATDYSHDGLTHATFLRGIERRYTADGTKQVGFMGLNYQLIYLTAMSAPDVAI